jgi:hypothetical protein
MAIAIIVLDAGQVADEDKLDHTLLMAINPHKDKLWRYRPNTDIVQQVKFEVNPQRRFTGWILSTLNFRINQITSYSRKNELVWEDENGMLYTQDEFTARQWKHAAKLYGQNVW